MHKLAKAVRLTRINYTLLNHNVDQVLATQLPTRSLKVISKLNPFNWRKTTTEQNAEQLKLALIKLGPIFVKLGQTLSTRSDILPKPMIDQLKTLQDQVPPIPDERAKYLIEKALGQNPKQYFKTINYTAIASASVAQVHRATLHDGSEVVIKILRPGIEKQIKRDVELMRSMAKLLQRFIRSTQHFKPLETIDEFARHLFDELDLLREAANASQMRRDFEQSEQLYIPKVFWPYCNKQLMVMEYIDGIRISDHQQLQKHQISQPQVAKQLVELFFEQILSDSIFHADMHPGNIFVNRDKAQHPQLMLVDFGIVSSLTPTDQRYLAENFAAFLNRDYRRVALLHIESGWLPSDTSVDAFETMIRSVCEPIFERPLGEISLGELMLRLFQTASQFKMHIQPQLTMLQKTLVNIEGLARELDPKIDLWGTAKPVIKSWLTQQKSPPMILKRLSEQLPQFAQKLNRWVNDNQPLTQEPIANTPSKTRFFKGLLTGIAASLMVGGLMTQPQFSHYLHAHWPLLPIGAGLLIATLFLG